MKHIIQQTKIDNFFMRKKVAVKWKNSQMLLLLRNFKISYFNLIVVGTIVTHA